jgi:RimJ/RimL family protein N-acetyltransferase
MVDLLVVGASSVRRRRPVRACTAMATIFEHGRFSAPIIPPAIVNEDRVSQAAPDISLHLFSEEDARRVLAGIRRPDEVWARDYPLFDEVDFLQAMVLDRANGRDPGPFGLYQVRLSGSGIVIGGASFFGPPDEFQAVEIMFGIVPDYAGNNYASQAVALLVDIARVNGALYVANLGAQKAMLNGGLSEVVRDERIVHFARELAV